MHIKPYFKKIDINDFTPHMHQEFINYLVNQRKSRNTILRIRNALYNAIKRVLINKTIVSNPCENVVMPKKEIDEKVKFLDSADNSLFF
ncbi:phage integrase SAM-like domain-containing protein [Amphibacillus sediminis]|uniref:phage integrase SAM-like domain-containing protein n=1 Tax=Amphibacillus sediminis TaxID=360185 RepID=UPI0008316D57